MERPFWILELIAPFLGKICLQVGQDGKSSQYYPVNASVPQNAIFGPMFFLPYTDLLDDVLCNIVKSVKEIVTGMKSWHNLPLRDEMNKEKSPLLQEDKIVWIAISITLVKGQWN